MSEVWKDIAGYEGAYQVSNFGNVRSIDRLVSVTYEGGKEGVKRRRGVKMRPKRIVGGYLMVSISRKGSDTGLLVHRLVLEAFVGPCPEGMEGCHNDSNPENNFLGNLRWDTSKSNHQDRVSNGTSGKGEKNGKSILKTFQVAAIRTVDCGKRGVAGKIAKFLGVSKRTVKAIFWGESWTHVCPEDYKDDDQFRQASKMMIAIAA